MTRVIMKDFVFRIDEKQYYCGHDVGVDILNPIYIEFSNVQRDTINEMIATLPFQKKGCEYALKVDDIKVIINNNTIGVYGQNSGDRVTWSQDMVIKY